jgi:hypothetical protein
VIDDRRGGTLTRDIAITVTGTNQLPEIVGGVFGATVKPTLGLGAIGGQISFVDADLSQTHQVTVLSALAEGDTTGLPGQAELLAWLDLDIATPESETPGAAQNLSWAFNPASFDFSYLGLTDQLRLTYSIEIRDSSGGLAVQDIVIVFRQSVLAAGVLSPIGGEVFAEDSSVDLAIPASLFAGTIPGSLAIGASLASGAPLPAWLSFDGERLTGTPPANFNGQVDIRITASNGTDAVHDFVGLSIEAVNDAPTIAGALSDYAFGAGSPITISVPAQAFTDVDGDVLAYSAYLADGSDLPTWLSFDDGIFTGTPPAGYQGEIGIVVIASDGISATEQSFNLAIGLANAAPSLAQPLYDWQIREDEAVDIVLRDTAFRDADGDVLTMTARLADGSDLPAWLSFDGVRITGMPPANFNGVLDIAVSASDGAASATDIFRLTIDPVNDAPVVTRTLDNLTLSSLAPFTIPVPSDLFADVDGDVLTLSATLADGSALPQWLSFDGVMFTGTPPAQFVGTLDLVLTAHDGSAIATSGFALSFAASNGGPVAAADILSDANEDSTMIIQPSALLGNDNDPESDPLQITEVTGAVGGTAELLADGTVRFIAAPNYTGPASFRYAISDGNGGTASATASFNLLGVNDAPIAVMLSPATINENAAGGTVVGTLSAIDPDATDTHGFAILAANMRLDQALLLDPAAPIGLAFNGVDAGQANSGLRLTSMGRYAGNGGQGAFTVWRIRNSNADERSVRLNAYSGLFDRSFVVPGDTDLYILSNDVSGSATHRLYLDSTLIDTRASSSTGFSASAIVSVANPMFEIVDNQLVLRSGANLDFERLAGVSVVVQATDAAGASTVQMLSVAINDVADFNVVTGTSANNIINGTAFADHLRGGSGDDRLNGNGGNDLLEGGIGLDTAGFAGLRASYQLVTQNGFITVVDTQGGVDGDDGSDMISSIERLAFRNGETVNVVSPIILDLDGGGVTTFSAEDSNARYDLDGDGLADDSSWFASGEGMLFLDRDRNGTVSNAGEFSFIDDVAGARSDLEGLRGFDSNSDDMLSSTDARFADFRIWRDRDSDGVAESGEILTLAAANVRSLNLTGAAVNGTTDFGEVAIVNRGTYTRTNGTTSAFIDAAFTYYSAAGNVPNIAVQALDFDRRARRYSISYANGAMTIAPNRNGVEVDPRAGALGASSLLRFANQTIGMLSPIILDLDGDGVEMRSIRRARAAFDMNGDGRLDNTGWTSGGDGFLVIDRDNDGRISHASELSFASEDSDASSDLEALAALDSNNDGVLNAADARFGELKIWVDADGDGITDAGELQTLADHDITEIGLRARHREGSADVGDNVLLSTAVFTRSNGSTGTVGNVALAYRPGATASLAGTAGDDEPLPDGVEGATAAALVAALSASRRSANSGALYDVNALVPEGVDPFDYFGDEPGFGLSSIPEQTLVEAASATAMFPTQQRVAVNAVEPDRVLSLMAQDMATFGVRSGADELSWRRDGARPIDFYA